MVVEDPACDVEEVADQRIAQGVAHRRAFLSRADDVRAPQDGELRGHRGLVEVERGLELVHVPPARAQELEDAHAERVGEGLEEVRLEGLQLGGRAVAHESPYILISLYSQF